MPIQLWPSREFPIPVLDYPFKAWQGKPIELPLIRVNLDATGIREHFQFKFALQSAYYRNTNYYSSFPTSLANAAPSGLPFTSGSQALTTGIHNDEGTNESNHRRGWLSAWLHHSSKLASFCRCHLINRHPRFRPTTLREGIVGDITVITALVLFESSKREKADVRAS